MSDDLHKPKTGYNYHSSDWRRQYWSSRNAWLDRYGRTLLREVAYTLCLRVFMLSMMLFMASLIVNFFMPSGRFDLLILGLLGLFGSLIVLSVGIALLMKFLILPIYERIRVWTKERPCGECATCAVNSFPPAGS